MLVQFWNVAAKFVASRLFANNSSGISAKLRQPENVDEKPAERNQIGVADYEQNRTGNNRVELSGTAGRGSEGSPPDAGRKDQEHRGASEGLRAAVDAAVRICSEFAAACRRLEQHVIERRKTLERERERPPRGMSR